MTPGGQPASTRLWVARVAQVSGLWTPDGEHPVPTGDDGDTLDTPADDELEAQVLAELAAARERLATVPAATVVANHAMGLFELAAIHLSVQPPHLDEAQVAIDAMAGVVDNVGDRLGEQASVLRDALAQIRLAFVQVKAAGTAD